MTRNKAAMEPLVPQPNLPKFTNKGANVPIMFWDRQSVFFMNFSICLLLRGNICWATSSFWKILAFVPWFVMKNTLYCFINHWSWTFYNVKYKERSFENLFQDVTFDWSYLETWCQHSSFQIYPTCLHFVTPRTWNHLPVNVRYILSYLINLLKSICKQTES